MKSCIKLLFSCLLIFYVMGCSSSKKSIQIEDTSLRSFVDSSGINNVNDFVDSTAVEKLSLNDLKTIYENIKNSNTRNEEKVLLQIMELVETKEDNLEYSVYLADTKALLDKYDTSDSIYINTLVLVRDSFPDSSKHLGRLYHDYASMKLQKDDFKSSIKLFDKSLRYAKIENDSTLLADNYTKLNEIYYYREILRSSLINYYKAFPIRIAFKDYNEAIRLTATNFTYYKSRGIKLSKFEKQMLVLDSLSSKFSTSNQIRFLLLKSTYVDNIDNTDKKLFTYYKQLDSLYHAEHDTFSVFVSDYVETFFPILNRLGKIKEATKLMETVLKDFNISQDSIINGETVNMAFWAYHTGQFGKSQQLFKKALKEYEQKYGTESPIVAELLDKIGVMYLSSGLTIEAYNLFDRALEIKEKHLEGDYLSMGISYNNIAESYRVGGEYRLAEKNYYLAVNSWEKMAADSANQWLTKAFHNLGVLYTDMGIYDTAKVSLDKAYKFKKQIFGKDSPELIYTYIALGKLYFKVGQYDSSSAAYDESKRIIEVTGLTNTLYDLSNHIGTGLLYAFMGDKDQEAKEQLLWAERYILSMEGFQEEKLRDIRKILLNIAKREENEEEQKRIATELYGEEDWDD